MKRIVCTLVLVCGFVQADIDFTQIKGLYSVFKTNQYLSPLHGFAWWQSGYTEELYRTGDVRLNTIKLVRELFFLQNDDVTFSPTILSSKIATYLTPRAIGRILSTLDAANNDYDLEKELLRVLSQEIDMPVLVAQTSAAQERLRVQSVPLIAGARDQAQKFLVDRKKAEATLADEEEQIKALTQKLTNLRSHYKALGKRKAPEDQIAQKAREVELAQQELDQKQRDIELIRSNVKQIRKDLDTQENLASRFENKIKNAALATDALKGLVGLLNAAYQETLAGNQQCMPYTVHNVLLSFLWKKVSSKADFIRYYQTLDPSVFIDSAFLVANSSAQQKWLRESFPDRSYQSMVPQLTALLQQENPDIAAFVRDHYEQLISAWYSYTVYTSAFPPQVISDITIFQNIYFPDCGETALRNFLNNVIFDSIQGRLNFSVLEKSTTVNPKLKVFYTQHGALTKIQEPSVREAWAAVVAELNTSGQDADDVIDYRNAPEGVECEIAARSGIKNMRNVLRKLLGVTDFDDLIARLAPSRNIRMDVTLEPTDTNFGILHFTLDGTHSFDWDFEPNHFFIVTKPYYYSSEPVLYDAMRRIIGALKNDVAELVTNELIFNLVMLYRDKLRLFDDLMAQLLTQRFSYIYQAQAFSLFFETKYSEDKMAFITYALKTPALWHDQHIMATIKKQVRPLTKYLTQDSNLVSMLISSPAFASADYPFKNDLEVITRETIEFIKNKKPFLMPVVIDTILNENAEKFYNTIKKQPFTNAQLRTVASKSIKALNEVVNAHLKTMPVPLSVEDRGLVEDIYRAKNTDFDPIIEKRLTPVLIQEIQQSAAIDGRG